VNKRKRKKIRTPTRRYIKNNEIITDYKVKLGISISESLLKALDRLSSAKKVSRSNLIEELLTTILGRQE